MRLSASAKLDKFIIGSDSDNGTMELKYSPIVKSL